jgi:hypothetical protein
MDRVKLYPQERLDLGDAGALQQLVYDYVQDALGAFIGPARGCLSQPVVSFLNGSPDKISFTDFSFIASKPIGNAILGVKQVNFASQIVKFDSLLSDHGNYPIPLTGVDNTMFLWARPLMVDTDLGNRRKWDVAQGAEVTFSDNTRSRMRVEFAFSATNPTIEGDDFQYSPLAKVTAINGTSISLTFISAFDSSDVQAVTGESGTFYDSANTSATAFSGMLPTYLSNTYDVNVGLLSIIHALGRMTRQMHAKGENDPAGTVTPAQWYNTQPKISLNGAYKKINTHDFEINVLQGQVGNLENQVLERGTVPFAYWIVAGNPLYVANVWHVVRGTTTGIYIDPANPNNFRLYMNNEMVNSGFYVNGCSVTQIHNPTNKNHNRMSVQMRWSANPTNHTDWVDPDVGNQRVFSFDTIPWELANEASFTSTTGSNDYNNLTNAASIFFLITLFGAPVNPYGA